MASILESNVVNYVCACGHVNPINKLYFCRYCLKLRCGYCVCAQVDSHFCCNCLENIPSTEAKFKKNRCNKCFDCPSCQHTLSSRANTVQMVMPRKAGEESGSAGAAGNGKEKEKESKPIGRKMYYLVCLACRWTSRDVGIPDQTVATGQWPDLEYAHATRFSLLLEHYQNVVLQEKQEKQEMWRRKAPKQHKFPSLTDRTGLNVSIARRQLGWSDKSTTKISQKPIINPSVASAEANDLPADIFTQELKLSNVTTLKQRLNNPAVQPYTVNNLYPQHKSLSIKRSVRCRQCEHYVIKPEFNPISIKYRIHLLASYHVPEVRLMKSYALKEGESSQVLIKFINPTMHDMNITISDLPTQDEELCMIDELRKKFDKQLTLTSTGASAAMPSNLSTSFTALASFIEVPKVVDQRVTGTIVLPDSQFVVYHRDDTAEFDEDQQILDDPKFVVWRRSNKVAIELTVNPLSNKSGDDIIVGFKMEYNYLNTFPNTPDKKDPQEHALSSRVYIKVGSIQ